MNRETGGGSRLSLCPFNNVFPHPNNPHFFDLKTKIVIEKKIKNKKMTLQLTEDDCSSESNFWGAFLAFKAENGKPDHITIPVHSVRHFQAITRIGDDILKNGFGQYLGIYVDVVW